MSNENYKKPEINYTFNYGKVDNNSQYYDVYDKVGKSIINYRISKIKCQLKENEGIYGIQFYYRNRDTGKNLLLINVERKDLDLIEQEMIFGIEEIINFRAWLSNDFKLIGFEVITNRGNKKKFGYGNHKELRICPELEDESNTIIGFGVTADDKNGVTGIYALYLNKIKYSLYIYGGVFSLRIKLKNKNYKKKIESILPNMNEKYQILYRICCLPENQFYNIIKYALI